MELIIRAASAAVVGSILALLLKKHTPELSLVTALSTGLMVVWFSAEICGAVSRTLRRLAQFGGIAPEYIAPVMKCVGIGMISNMAAQVCRDAEQGAAASAVELCGVLCALYSALPLVESLLTVVERLV